MNFKCKKCNSSNYKLKLDKTGKHTGLYCAECDFWHKWIPKDKMYLYNQTNKDQEDNAECEMLSATYETKPISVGKAELFSSCIICGESYKPKHYLLPIGVCENCKKAVMKMREVTDVFISN